MAYYGIKSKQTLVDEFYTKGRRLELNFSVDD
ncbi:hypothetical protein JOD82_002162 [Paenibacillus sp. 1182]|nr:hypothetical protein [Paenibacillus sp. 1182]